MDELLYLLLGWLLGLLGPRVIDSIKAGYDRRALAAAIKEEAQDLQYRVAASCFLLRQRYGEVTEEYLAWLKPKLAAYRGNEPIDAVRQFVEVLLSAPDEQVAALVARMRAPEDVGLSLKTFSSGFIESNLAARLLCTRCPFPFKGASMSSGTSWYLSIKRLNELPSRFE